MAAPVRPAPQRRRRRWPWASLLLTVVFLALAVTAIIVIAPINREHVTIDRPDPGAISLPPTAPAVMVTGSPTR